MRRILSLAAVTLFAAASTAAAQRSSTGATTPVELGIDGTLNFGLGGTNTATIFDMPMGRLRAGFFMSPEMSLEPTFSLTHEGQSGASATDFELGTGLLYHFSASRTQNQVYVRPFINFINQRASFTAGGTTTTVSTNLFELGAGLGVKVPWKERLSWRLEANLSHNTKQYIDNSDNRFGVLFGLSYFTR